ncbi:phosphoribosylaminoimidazolesuccinocarboxamide synthase [Streptomyces nogalater]
MQYVLHDGTWVEPVIAHTDVVLCNIGRMLAQASDGRFRPSTHRVHRPDTQAGYERLSAVLFAYPPHDARQWRITTDGHLTVLDATWADFIADRFSGLGSTLLTARTAPGTAPASPNRPASGRQRHEHRPSRPLRHRAVDAAGGDEAARHHRPQQAPVAAARRPLPGPAHPQPAQLHLRAGRDRGRDRPVAPGLLRTRRRPAHRGRVRCAFRGRVAETLYLAEYRPAPPFEVIVKNVATGSTTRKYPGLFPDGQPLPRPVVKFDYRVDPEDQPIGEDYLRALGLPVGTMREQALVVNDVLRDWLAPLQVWDFCLVFGTGADGELCLISEVSQDCMRLRHADGSPLDKDLFRDGVPGAEIVHQWKRAFDAL